MTALVPACVYPGEAPPKPKPQRYEFAQRSMGVEFRILIYSLDPERARLAARRAFQRIQALDDALSNYKPDSELMRLCRLAEPGLPIPVSEDLFRVLAISKRLHRLSHGAFEISVGPLTQLWRRSRKLHRLPKSEILAAAKKRVGSEWIRLDHARHTVEFLKRGILLDPGGIAKGYAVDQALLSLEKNGIHSALVDGSGDIAASDPPPDLPGWKIAISPSGDRVRTWVYLAHGAIATSGDLYGRVILGGKRYSHIVDPKTGLGLVDSKAVTVFHPSCTYADGLATALSVLSPGKGMALIRKLGKAGAILDLGPKGLLQEPADLGLLPYIQKIPVETISPGKDPSSQNGKEKGPPKRGKSPEGD